MLKLAAGRAHWNGKGGGGSGWWGNIKLSDLQRECRKRDIWPGGDMPFVKDRLLRSDFCPSTLLSCETRSEEIYLREQNQVGVLYYKVVQTPIDLKTIEAKLDASAYFTVEALENDLLRLLANARKFAAEISKRGFPEGRQAQEDAATLLTSLRKTARACRTKETAARRDNEKALQGLLKRVARDMVSNVKAHERQLVQRCVDA